MPDLGKESLWGFKFLGSSSGGAMPPEEQERVRRQFLRGGSHHPLPSLPSSSCASGSCSWCRGRTCSQRSEHNRIRLQDLPPWRGRILDRQGRVLVANRPSYELVAVLEDVGDIPPLARRLADLAETGPEAASRPVGERPDRGPLPGADPGGPHLG